MSRTIIYKPKPIKPFSNVTRIFSSTFLEQSLIHSASRLGVRSASGVNLHELPMDCSLKTGPSLEKLGGISPCKNIETLLRVEEELRNLSARTCKGRVVLKDHPDRDTVVYRPSNPMVSDEFWNSDCSFSTEGEHEITIEANLDELVGMKRAHSL